MGLTRVSEPFANLLTQGMVLNARSFYRDSAEGRKQAVLLTIRLPSR
jgi:hypothetical protein